MNSNAQNGIDLVKGLSRPGQGEEKLSNRKEVNQ